MIFQGPGNKAGLLERLEALGTLEDWQLKQGPFLSVDYSGKEILRLSTERAVLDGSIFQDCRLVQGDFLQSNLQDVVFRGSVVEETALTSCQLRSSVWEDSRLREVSFKGCAGPRLQIRRTVLERCLFDEVEVNRGEIRECCFWQSRLAAEHPSGTTGFRSSVFEGCLFFGCTLSGSLLAFASLEGCVFLNCRFFGVDWECVDRGRSLFIDCTGGPLVPRIPKNSIPFRSWEDFEQEVLSGTA